MYTIRKWFHNVTHRHRVAMKGDSVIYICWRRGPWGKPVIRYQPNRYIEPFEITVDQFKKVLQGEPL